MFRRLVRWAVGRHDAASLTLRNSLTAPYLWLLSSLAAIPATLFWRHPHVLQAFVAGGLFVVNPNESRVLQLFGRYKGSVKDEGFLWANPLLTKTTVSLRLHNFETGGQPAQRRASAAAAATSPRPRTR